MHFLGLCKQILVYVSAPTRAGANSPTGTRRNKILRVPVFMTKQLSFSRHASQSLPHVRSLWIVIATLGQPTYAKMDSPALFESFTCLTSFPDDCLPPECEYDSRESLFKEISAWAKTRGYAFITGRSKKEKTGKLTITYSCDRCYAPASPSSKRQRKTTTRGTLCPFSILAKQSLDKTTWSIRHRLDQKHSLHNHKPSLHLSTHPVHRKLSNKDRTKVSSLLNAGIASKDIRIYIR